MGAGDAPHSGIKRLADEALAKLDSTFVAMYSAIGPPSSAPERLLLSDTHPAIRAIPLERARHAIVDEMQRLLQQRSRFAPRTSIR